VVGSLAKGRLWRELLWSGLVGVVAGMGAVVFNLLTSFISHYALGWLVGFSGGPHRETGIPALLEATGTPFRPWLVPIVLAAGGLVSGFLVYRFAPEAEGHGTDAAIDAYHNRRGIIRPIVPIIKMLASAVTVGTGGSGGREGPIAQVGAGFGSFLATRLGLTEAQRRILLLAGVGAGIGSIFHAPLAGAIFAIEVLYRDPDFESEALIPAFLGTTVAYSVFAFVLGLGAFEPLFTVGTDLKYSRPFVLLLPLAVLALLMSAAARVYVRVFYGVHDYFHRLRLPRMLKPAIGAGLAGLLALGLFYGLTPCGRPAQFASLEVLHFGYGFLQNVLDPATGVELSIIVLVLVGFGKMVTTSLTIGSGGSAGVFGPSMVVGGSLGAVVGLGFHYAIPSVVGEPDVVVFALLGMASFFAAAAKTPVSTLIMVSELTSGYALLLPSMWVCAIAYLTSGPKTLYREQKKSRADSPAHRGDFIVDIVEGLTVHDALTETHRRFEAVPVNTPLLQLSRMITSTVQSSFPVIDAEGRYAGLFSLDDIRAFLYDASMGSLAIAGDVATHDVEPLRQEMSLSDALHRFAETRYDELPVVDSLQHDRVIAMLHRRDLISAYDRRLIELKAV
jgi:CIC family chloride channel protein